MIIALITIAFFIARHLYIRRKRRIHQEIEDNLPIMWIPKTKTLVNEVRQDNPG